MKLDESERIKFKWVPPWNKLGYRPDKIKELSDNPNLPYKLKYNKFFATEDGKDISAADRLMLQTFPPPGEGNLKDVAMIYAFTSVFTETIGNSIYPDGPVSIRPNNEEGDYKSQFKLKSSHVTHISMMGGATAKKINVYAKYQSGKGGRWSGAKLSDHVEKVYPFKNTIYEYLDGVIASENTTKNAIGREKEEISKD